jgi:hypothetical protein
LARVPSASAAHGQAIAAGCRRRGLGVESSAFEDASYMYKARGSKSLAARKGEEAWEGETRCEEINRRW